MPPKFGISKLPVRQVTGKHVLYRTSFISKLPVRQVTKYHGMDYAF